MGATPCGCPDVPRGFDGPIPSLILESIADGVFTVDREWRITSFNRAAEEITSVPRSSALGRFCRDVFRSSMCATDCALERTVRTGQPIIGRSAYIVDGDGAPLAVSVSTAALRDRDGHIIGGAETFRDLSLVETPRYDLEEPFRLGRLVTRSPSMRPLFDLLPAVAATTVTVLLAGETGTGKEVLAHAIHDLSPRRQGPFIAVNCAAVPDTLFESELFGYLAGAFTGADRDKVGRFALAENGTLFLDEIGDISPAVQGKLLRVLQERIYEPLGSTQPSTTNARLIVATSRDLGRLTAQGVFREDLYYRVNVVRLDVPALRRRKEDVGLLASWLLERFNRLHGRSVKITPEALSLLAAYDWPGNVRQLENVIERALVLCRRGHIDVGDLPVELTGGRRPTPQPRATRTAHDMLDAQAIRAALERHDGSRAAAARELGIHTTTLFRRMRRLRIPLPRRDGRSAGRRHPSSPERR